MDKNREIGLRIKEFVEKNFSSTAELARIFGKSRSYFRPYFKGTSLPGAEILSKLAELGCDINWLLTGKEPAASQVKEPSFPYNSDVDERFKKLEERIKKLEDQKTKWMEYSASVLEQYKKDCSDKDEIIARLSVEFISLVAANHVSEKVEYGTENNT